MPSVMQALFPSIPQPPVATYDDWLDLGMALHSTEEALGALRLQDQWSMQSSKYEEGKQEKSWRSLRLMARTIGTLFFMAKSTAGTAGTHRERRDRGLFRIWHRPPADATCQHRNGDKGTPHDRAPGC